LSLGKTSVKFEGENWHTPPSWFELNPYETTSTFTVIRNPYDRIISEYYCPYYGFQRRTNNRGRRKPKDISSLYRGKRNRGGKENRIKDSHREIIREKILNKYKNRGLVKKQKDSQQQEEYSNKSERRHRKLKWEKSNKKSSPQQKLGGGVMVDSPRTLNSWIRKTLSRGMNMNTGHTLPQYYYIFDGEEREVITHLLRFENLTQEFAELTNQYNLPIILDYNTKMNTGHYDNNNNNNKMTVDDLDPRTISIINEFYDSDFRLLGYDKIIVPKELKKTKNPKIPDEKTI